MDDFATGYSALRYIKESSLDSLKINQSFIHDIPDNKSNCVLVDTVIVIAKHMDISITAEGGRTWNQEQFFLHARDRDQYPSYIYSKHLPKKECKHLIFKADGVSWWR